jgi:hypothetical protein
VAVVWASRPHFFWDEKLEFRFSIPYERLTTS